MSSASSTELRSPSGGPRPCPLAARPPVPPGPPPPPAPWQHLRGVPEAEVVAVSWDSAGKRTRINDAVLGTNIGYFSALDHTVIKYVRNNRSGKLIKLNILVVFVCPNKAIFFLTCFENIEILSGTGNHFYWLAFLEPRSRNVLYRVFF